MHRNLLKLFKTVPHRVAVTHYRHMANGNKCLGNTYQDKEKKRELISLEPGMVIIKRGLTEGEQSALTNLILEEGSHPTNGFWKKDPANKSILNVTPYRGRMFKPIKKFPVLMENLSQRNLDLAAKFDETLKTVLPTHSIILYYKTLAEAHVIYFIQTLSKHFSYIGMDISEYLPEQDVNHTTAFTAARLIKEFYSVAC